MTFANQKPAVQSAAVTKTQKRKEPGDLNAQIESASDFMNELRQLKMHLTCATHHGHWCYVSLIDAHHKELDIFVLTLWAKKIVRGDLQSYTNV